MGGWLGECGRLDSTSEIPEKHWCMRVRAMGYIQHGMAGWGIWLISSLVFSHQCTSPMILTTVTATTDTNPPTPTTRLPSSVLYTFFRLSSLPRTA